MDLLLNKTARHNYEILDTFEAGIQLHGHEVKTLRAKHGSLKEAYITNQAEILQLVKCHIPPYQPGHAKYENVDTYRPRTLLLHKKQIQKLSEELKQKGKSLIPLRIYLKGNLIKLEFALARGKKKHDKRQDLRDRTSKRDAERAIKNSY